MSSVCSAEGGDGTAFSVLCIEAGAKSREISAKLTITNVSADGSVTLYIQKDSPGADKESNWLPAPNGPIYLAMRLYWPKEHAPSILPPGGGTWNPPALVKVN